MATVNFTLVQLLDKLDKGEIINFADLTPAQLAIPITGLATLEKATLSDIGFLANPRYQKDLSTTQAGAVLIHENNLADCPPNVIPLVCKNPYLTFAKLTEFFAYRPQPTRSDSIQDIFNSSHGGFIHPTAVIAPTATLGQHVHIGAYCVIGNNATIGDGCQLDSHVTVGDFTKLGKACHLYSHVHVAHDCQLGNHVTLHSHASIGNEGFGYAPKGDPASIEGGWQPIRQLGRVVIGDNVRVGSHTCIDRGALDDTVIAHNVIIDNLVQIAHNVHIGAGTAIAGCVGIAGSTKIGQRCVLAGGVGLVGHIEVCDDVTVTGMTMVTKSITQAGSYSSGTPMLPTGLWRKMAVKVKNLV